MLNSTPTCRSLNQMISEGGRHATSDVQSSAKPLSSRYLLLVEREEIALLRAQGHSTQAIGRHLGWAGSTISRELRRNAATRCGGLEYRATTAQWHADRSARRPKPTKLALNTTLRTYVEERLAGVVVASSGALVPGPAVRWKGRRHGPRKDRQWVRAWNPEQIARRLPIDFPDDETMRISHEAIYKALFVQGRGALRRELTACLRTGRVLRVPRARVRRRGKGFVSPEIMISQRPVEAADRAVPGHWEGDFILGLGSSGAPHVFRSPLDGAVPGLALALVLPFGSQSVGRLVLRRLPGLGPAGQRLHPVRQFSSSAGAIRRFPGRRSRLCRTGFELNQGRLGRMLPACF